LINNLNIERKYKMKFLFILFILLLLNLNKCDDKICDENGVCENTVDTEIVNGVKIPKGANSEGKPKEVSKDKCEDRTPRCKQYSKQGECDKNPGWMAVNCPRSCNACHLLDPKVRCDRNRLNMSTSPIYAPGDMDNMFESIERDFGDKYGINIISRSPWIVTFDNFMTDIEVGALIQTVEGTWERSTDTGKVNEYGETGRVVSESRTSSNAWCRHDCENDPNVKAITRKIEEITRVPQSNYESFQVLRYEVGQKYNAHHDMSHRQTLLACGPRILTFFLYLSDVEEGGETAFPHLNIAIKPKKGSALLWPSTLNDNPESMDARTTHEARAVIKGQKYAANTWIHLYNFQQPNLHGCTGTFDNV